jgi:hypothetical protein
MYPDTILVRQHQDIRNRLGLGDDCEIIEIRRPAPENRITPNGQPIVILDNSPVRPVARSGRMPTEAIPVTRSYARPPEFPPSADGRYGRPVDAPAFFVRQVEQTPPAARQYRHATVPPRLETQAMLSTARSNGYGDGEPAGRHLERR